MDLPWSVKKLQQPDCPHEDGSHLQSHWLFESRCFFPSPSTLVLRISLMVASLISQPHLVSACFSNGPLFKHLFTSPSADFPQVDSCQSMCQHLKFSRATSWWVRLGCSPYCGQCPALQLVFLNAREYLPFLTSK